MIETSDGKADFMERAEKVAVGPDREERELLRLLKAALAGNSDREKINSS